MEHTIQTLAVKNLEEHGTEWMQQKLIEEAGELIVELSTAKPSEKLAIASELADVQILLTQILVTDRELCDHFLAEYDRKIERAFN